MSVAVNPYTQGQSQLGFIEAGLKTLKHDKGLLGSAEFSDMYFAVERHHRDLRLAHLTGKAKDLMEQATKDTRFYNILVKMLCEIKKLPKGQEKRKALAKTYNWYINNRHTLATGPKFGKSSAVSTSDETSSPGFMKSSTSSSYKTADRNTKSATTFSSSRKPSSRLQKNVLTSARNERKTPPDNKDDNMSSVQGFGDTVSMNPPSEPASSRLSMLGNDFMTNRFFMDLPSSKLSWHLESPEKSIPDWNVTEYDNFDESCISRQLDYHTSPRWPLDGDESPRSEMSGGSSGADVGSADMLDFHSEVPPRLSRGPTSGGSGRANMSEDQGSSSGYGLQRRMVHSIASLVNPHAKLAENEAYRQEEDYIRDQYNNTPLFRTTRSQSAAATYGSGNAPVLSNHIPVMQAVSVTNNRPDHSSAFNNFRTEHVYGQEILSKLKFVGRSGTAFDVRYTAHPHGATPEQFTNSVLQKLSAAPPSTTVDRSEPSIHTQPLEEFYKTAENYYPINTPKQSRLHSAPSATRNKRGSMSAHHGHRQELLHPQRTSKSAGCIKLHQPDGSTVNGGRNNGEIESEKTSGKTLMKLETVVHLVDHVTQQMVHYKENVAPTPMSGFRQPASTSVSNKPLSRPGSTSNRNNRPKSSQPVRRSPSPVGRPCTPTEESILMNGGEVEIVTGPVSSSVSKAVDWRGKVTPQLAKYKSKTRFGGHSYIQKIKPSLRTAGVSFGVGRPKTAPISTRERWNTKDKECDKNKRVQSQAASNTMREVDNKDIEQYINIHHLLGTSGSRNGSMGSLFLDEEFLRSFNSRYSARSAMSHMMDDSQREFLTFISPTPRLSPREPASRASHKRKQLEEVAEVEQGEISDQEELPGPDQPDLQTQGGTDARAEKEEGAVVESNQESEYNNNATTNENAENTDNANQNQVEGSVEKSPREAVVVPSQREVPIRELVHVLTEDKENGVHIEVTALPAKGLTQPTPSKQQTQQTQALSSSSTWQYKPDYLNITSYPSGSKEIEYYHSKCSSDVGLNEPRRPYSAFDKRLIRSEGWSKNIVKPENYCFKCIPENMSMRVGRSAGRMPGGAQSPKTQMLRMSRRQSDQTKQKAQPQRTAPSIPSPHHSLGRKSPRQGQQYSAELEYHARKINSPRHFIEHVEHTTVVDLRTDLTRSLPANQHIDDEDILGSLSVISLKVPPRSHTAPSTYRYNESVNQLPSQPEETEENTNQNASFNQRPSGGKTSIAHTGRPIPQVTHIPDPDLELEAVKKQREAKAAVDIQRIFRGYVCRNSYLNLLWEHRKTLEDKQQASMDSQREWKKHVDRKSKIYKRPPLDPALLQWAADFKQIQLQHKIRRQEKEQNLQEEFIANRQKSKSKIELVGPHVEIYDIYHPKETGPSKRDMHKAAVRIQKHARGFLIRHRFKKLRRKAVFCGSTWEKIVKEYKNLLLRIQRWHGVEKPNSPFSLQHMNEYMDLKRRYESQFDKKAFGGDLELPELEAFFKECDLYPSGAEIEEGLDVITQGQSLRKGGGLKKSEALNLLFYIYVPAGTGLTHTRQSTWMNPIIDGVEAKKFIGNDVVEGAPLKPCANLVIQSRRERREHEQTELAIKLAKERKERGEESDSDDGEAEKKRQIEALKQQARNVFEQRK